MRSNTPYSTSLRTRRSSRSNSAATSEVQESLHRLGEPQLGGSVVGDRAVGAVAVDVEGDAAPGLVVRALELVDALMGGPEAVGQAREVEDAIEVVPVCDPYG